MRRMAIRGRILYYGTAVVLGCALASALEFASIVHGAHLSQLLAAIALAVSTGWFTAVLFAFTLRAITTKFALTRKWQWGAIGFVVIPMIIFFLRLSYVLLGRTVQSIYAYRGAELFESVADYIFLGAVILGSVIVETPEFAVFISLIGAITAVILCMVNNRIERPISRNPAK